MADRRHARGWRRRRARWPELGATLLLSVLVLVATGPPAGAAPAEDGGELVSGVEGAKAALVRIEVSAIADIAHIDHSTGDVNVMMGEYEVPIRSGTGVFTSKDGVVATTGSTLLVTEDQVVVHAANRLFTEQMGTALTGNDGDLSRRAQAVDPYWAPHLQHCYERVEHCILFFRPVYEVLPYTAEPTSAPAELVHPPATAADVGLLRIGGGGGTPTAELAPAGQALPGTALLVAFTQPPDPTVPPSTMTVGVDPGSGALSSEQDLAAALATGGTSGPVLDPATGQVAGLAATVDGQPTVVPTQRLREVLDAAGTPPEGSAFDAVFRQGIDHLTSGHTSGPAASSFRESMTYYESALAAQYVSMTAGAADEPADPTAAAGQDDGGDGVPWPWLGGGAAVALLLLALALLARRRRAGRSDPDPDSADGLPVTVRSAPPEPSPDRTPTVRAPPAPVGAVARPAPGPGQQAPGAPSPVAPPGAPAARDHTRLQRSPAPLPTAGQSATYCWQCGAAVRAGARFCAGCGSPVG
ncbi:zinc ribbon domain-containing protein [Modestobacter versicolor]|uniref:zinc ribbon domain-containing protein n=1 Tax=Modestobacter versicolor TaxID=429133 RepID=UPI0034DF6941